MSASLCLIALDPSDLAYISQGIGIGFGRDGCETESVLRIFMTCRLLSKLLGALNAAGNVLASNFTVDA